MFIIESSDLKIDTLYSIDTNTTQMYLKPETDYEIKLYQNGQPTYISSKISTKGKTKSAKLIEEFYVLND